VKGKGGEREEMRDERARGKGEKREVREVEGFVSCFRFVFVLSMSPSPSFFPTNFYPRFGGARAY
jgi:hypothetical protein